MDVLHAVREDGPLPNGESLEREVAHPRDVCQRHRRRGGATAPDAGFLIRRATRRTVYTMSVQKTRLHLYDVIDEARQLVTVLQAWSQYRRGPPRL